MRRQVELLRITKQNTELFVMKKMIICKIHIRYGDGWLGGTQNGLLKTVSRTGNSLYGMRKSGVLALLMLCCSMGVFAQRAQRYTISGYMRDSLSTESLIGATVFNKAEWQVQPPINTAFTV